MQQRDDIEGENWYRPEFHGCIKGRRRQGAILAKLRLAHHLRRMKKPHMHMFHDTTNAPASTTHEANRQALSQVVLQEDEEIASHSYKQCCIQLECPDGVAEVVPTEGGFQGTSMTVRLF